MFIEIKITKTLMENSNTICPVCTLYMREGITLQAHLDTHPKEQVIEALLQVSNGGAFTTQQTSSSSSATSFMPLQAFTNSSSSFVSSPYVNPQTQLTTAVTYQHFMTSNGSTVMPQYIQVPAIVNPNNNIPLLSNQSVNCVPNQSVNYSQTVYNPLYNPYVPQPYPFNQPVFSTFPVSSAPTTDLSSVQASSQNEPPTSSDSRNTNQQNQGTAVIQPSLLVKKCNVSTSTECKKKGPKKGTKKSVLRCSATHRKRRIFRTKHSEPSSTLSVIRSPSKSITHFGRVSTFLKKSIIQTIRPKIASTTSSSTPNSNSNNIRMLSPPPLTLITGTTNAISSSKTPPPPPLAKAPYIVSQSIKNENGSQSVRPKSTPAIIFSSTKSDCKCTEKAQKTNSVIVDSSDIRQCEDNELNECQEIETSQAEVPCGEELMDNILVSKDNLINSNKDPLCTAEENEIRSSNLTLTSHYNNEAQVNQENRENEDNEKQEKIFQMIVVEENKIDVCETLTNEDLLMSKESNHESSFTSTDIFTEEENAIFSDGLKSKDNTIRCTEKAKFRTGELYNKNFEKENERDTCNEYNYYNKDFNEMSYDTTRYEGNYLRNDKATERQPATYANLEPAKTSKVFCELGLSSPVNLNSFMEVDGIQIYFNNNNATSIPFDPLIKVSNIPPLEENSLGSMKIEKQLSSSGVGDSVIQLVQSGRESKHGFTFEGNFSATTSQNNGSQVDVPDGVSELSPLALNIQADESMPARGELSEQESLGAENSTWSLFHGENANSPKSLEWSVLGNAQQVSVIGNKATSRSFKCSTCNEVFSCPKERRVHKNTAHMNNTRKGSPSTKKPKSYACSFCNIVFTTLRDRKMHVVQNHFVEPNKRKTSNLIKEEGDEIDGTNNSEKVNASVKSETVQDSNIKTETSVDAESQRVKYCARCSLPFVGVKKLREHLRTVHGEIRFKCETCSQCFDEESEYNDHLIIHPLVCDKCGKTFHRKPNLNLHMKRHLEVKPYECSLCPKSFITRQKLEEHMNGHSGKKPLKCTLCDKTFSRHSNLIQHRNLHHSNVKKKIKDFVCRCGEVFHSLRKLEWHKEVHEAKPKPCPFCSQKFIHSASVTRHIRRAHLPDYLPGQNREFDNVQCPICEKVYLRSSLVVHMRVHNGEKPFACKICNKRFSTKWNLELHNWTHQSRSNMPFKCHICKGAFFREPDFVAHLNAHRNYKPFTCNICGQKFIRKYSCLRHQEEHKKSKQFVCAVSGCAKSFHRGYYLRDHMKVHTGVRPHTCHICGKASSTKSNHNKHVRIHDTREPVNTEN